MTHHSEFKNHIRTILGKHGFADETDLDIGDEVTIERDDDEQDLVIEKTREQNLSVKHVYEDNGNECYEPQLIFDISNPDEWNAVFFRNDRIRVRVRDPCNEEIRGVTLSWTDRLITQQYVERDD